MPSRAGGKLRASPLWHPKGLPHELLPADSTLLGFTASAQAQALRIGMRDDPDILDPTLSRT